VVAAGGVYVVVGVATDGVAGAECVTCGFGAGLGAGFGAGFGAGTGAGSGSGNVVVGAGSVGSVTTAEG
jgi:hypothetical protein